MGTGLRKVINSLTDAVEAQKAAQEGSSNAIETYTQKIQKHKDKIAELEESVKNGTKSGKAAASAIKKQQEAISDLEEEIEGAKNSNNGSVLDQIGIKREDIVDANGNFKDMTSIMKVLREHTKGLGSEEKNAVFNSLFGTTGQQAGAILAENSKHLGDLTKKVEEAGKKGNYVQELAAKNAKTAENSNKRFKEAWSALEIEFGAKLLPYMTDAANQLTKIFEQEEVQKDVKLMAKGVGEVANAIFQVGKLAIEYRKPLVVFGGALAGVLAVSKVVDFINKMKNLRSLFGKNKALLEEQVQVGALTKEYQNLALAKSQAGGAYTGGTVSKTANTASEVGNIAETAIDATTTKGGKTITKNAGKLKMLGRSLGTKIVGGLGLAVTAWDVGSSIYDAVKSNKAEAKYQAAGKTAGTLVGGTIGAFIGGPGGAMIGASIGEQIGGSKTVTNALKKFKKSWDKMVKGEKLEAPKMSEKESHKQLLKEQKEYYKQKQKQDLDDLKTLQKNGMITKEEYKKRVDDAKKHYKDLEKEARRSGSDQSAIDKYYAIQKQKIDTDYNKEKKKIHDKYDREVWSAQQSFGKKSEQYKKAVAKRDKELDEASSKHKKKIYELNEKYATTNMTKEAKQHTTLTGKIQLETDKQGKILEKLTAKKGKLSNKQLQAAVNNAQKEYDKITKLANDEYKDVTKKADKKYKKVKDAAERQRKSAIKAADEQYKKTVEAAERQYSGNSKWAKEQRKAVKEQAEKQRDEAHNAANDQYKQVTEKAKRQHDETVDKADKQRSETTRLAGKQRDDVTSSAREQSKGVVTHAVNQANSSMDANSKQAQGSSSIFESLLGFFKKIGKLFGKSYDDSKADLYKYKHVTAGAYATGGQASYHGKALVGEAGPELIYRPYSGKVGIAGQMGPQFIDVRPGDRILNAKDTAKVMSGSYVGTLPGYATGNISLGDFFKKVREGAEDIYDHLSDTASDILDKITDPKKTLLDIATKTFNLDSVPDAGIIARDITKGMVNDAVDGLAGILKKIKDSFSVGGGSGNSPNGTMSKNEFGKVARHAASLMHQKLSARDIEHLYWQAFVESNVNPVTGGGYDDHDGTGLPYGLFQYKIGTWNAWAVNGHKNIHSALDQIMAVLNDSNWRNDFAPIGVRRGWGPRGHRMMANGGLVTQNQMVEISEGNLPEMVVPLDLSKRSRAYQLMQQSLDYFAQTDNSKRSDGSGELGKDVKELSETVKDLKNLVGMLLNVNRSQIEVIKGINGYDKTKVYRDMASDQRLANYQQFNV